VQHWRNFILGEDAKLFFTKCQSLSKSKILQSEYPVTPNGRKKTLRKSAGFGDKDFEHAYNGMIQKSRPWPPWLLPIRKRLERMFSQKFEFALINEYSAKDAAIGPHADDEKTIVSRSIIVSISLGATRTLQLTDKDFGKVLRSITLHSGSLYSMELDTQDCLKHAILPGEQEEGPRYSITFRHIIPIHKRKLLQTEQRRSKKNKDLSGAGPGNPGRRK